jgi:ketosteroid isomerase-like protein
MSQANVEVVRQIYDAVARRDSVTPFRFYADDIVWDLSTWAAVVFYSRPVYRGHDGVRELWRETLAAFGEVDFQVEEVIDGGERVVAAIREREIGRASGVPVEARHTAVWTLADGKVTRMQIFSERPEALEAAGLRE